MNAFLRKQAVWKYRNERALWKLVETSADVYVDCVTKAGRVTSFLLYMVYRTPGLMLAITEWILQGPELKRREHPHALAFEVEPNVQVLEHRLTNTVHIR